MFLKQPHKLFRSAVAALLAAGAWALPSFLPYLSSDNLPARAAGARENQQDRKADLAKLLDRRAIALNKRDREAFLSTVDKQSPAFVQDQTKAFDNSAGLPISDYSLQLDLIETDEFTRKKDRRKYNAPVVVAAVDMRSVLSGYDQKPGLRDLTFTFVKRADGWKIASDSDLEDLGELTDKELWDFGPVETSQSEHFLLISHPEQAKFAPEILKSAEESVAIVDRVWKGPWHKKVPIMVPSTGAELTRLLEADFDISDFLAFAVSSVDRQNDQAWQTSSHRIILNRENFLELSPGVRIDTLAHELVHIATRESTGPFVSVFVEEGFAQLTDDTAAKALNARLRSRGLDRKLPASWEFFAGGRTNIINSYQEAASSFLYLQERFGIEAINRIYIDLGRVRVEPGTDRYHLDRVFRQVLGISFEDFERQWADNAASTAG